MPPERSPKKMPVSVEAEPEIKIGKAARAGIEGRGT